MIDIMDWVNQAKSLFLTKKPAHFTNYRHCEECAEHDETLRKYDIDTIGLDQLGNPGWDPICFATPQAKHYYMPAFVRLSLDSLTEEFYFSQFLFHLEADGADNDLHKSCTFVQRKFLASFIEYMINSYTELLEQHYCGDEALRAFEIWSMPK